VFDGAVPSQNCSAMETETNVVGCTSRDVCTLPNHGSELIGLEDGVSAVSWVGCAFIVVPI
jgi:hypothetical protein